ncbi:MAG: twin-arginine translocation signal domain-containing protein, partial [Alphaproteobacteria bacterium]|nr:twin-arginine translocation signal domain-containing protein [Alphaproteobacteria bacterium]
MREAKARTNGLQARLTRRQALALSGAGVGAALFGASGWSPASAQTRVTVDEANLRPRPIAIPPF